MGGGPRGRRSVTERGQRRRVLVIEDEVIVGMLLEDMLDELGCEVAAISTQIEEALQLARTLDIDLAILDINLGGKQSFPVADVLSSRRRALHVRDRLRRPDPEAALQRHAHPAEAFPARRSPADAVAVQLPDRRRADSLGPTPIGWTHLFAGGCAAASTQRECVNECQLPAQTGCSDRNTPCWPKRPL